MSKIRDLIRNKQVDARTAADKATTSAAQAAADQAAAQAAERALREAEKQAAAEFKANERRLAAVVSDLEAGAKRLISRPVPAERPQHDVRGHARSFLMGGGSEVHHVVDQQAHELHSLGSAATRTLGEVEECLGAEHTLATRVDRIECELWRAFICRVRVLAGEV